MKHLSILVAEDDQLSQILMKLILTGSGHTVTIAVNGKEAVNCFKRNKYDLILMDILMPEMDGIEAARQIRGIEFRRTPGLQTPLIAVTADCFNTRKIQLAGFDEILIKPFKISQLNDILISRFPDYGQVGQC